MILIIICKYLYILRPPRPEQIQSGDISAYFKPRPQIFAGAAIKKLIRKLLCACLHRQLLPQTRPKAS